MSRHAPALSSRRSAALAARVSGSGGGTRSQDLQISTQKAIPTLAGCARSCGMTTRRLPRAETSALSPPLRATHLLTPRTPCHIYDASINNLSISHARARRLPPAQARRLLRSPRAAAGGAARVRDHARRGRAVGGERRAAGGGAVPAAPADARGRARRRVAAAAGGGRRRRAPALLPRDRARPPSDRGGGGADGGARGRGAGRARRRRARVQVPA